MTAVVFAGPTISAAEVERILAADCRGPAAQGDVYRAARAGCAAIGLVDGFFHGVPSVWHKEILWALHQGVHVFGAASMGALRAAELAPWGMVGVGEVFESFLRGDLNDDDEVAVVHRDAGDGYAPLSEAMVNVRATLDAAVAEEVIDRSAAGRLTEIARSLFYGDRHYDRILALAGREVLAAAEIERLRAWLPGGRRDRKRDDAVAMLTAMASADIAVRGPRPAWRFERTTMWERMVHDVAAEGASADEDVLAELLLDPGLLALAMEGAAARHHRLEEADRRGVRVAADEVAAAEAGFRRLHRLGERDGDDWSRANGLEPEAFAELMADEAALAAVRLHLRDGERARLTDWLRAAGHYGRLSALAAAKSRDLAAAGLGEATPETAGVALPDLLRWFFQERVAGTDSRPAELGVLMQVAREQPEAFRRAVLREHCHERLRRATTATDGRGKAVEEGTRWP